MIYGCLTREELNHLNKDDKLIVFPVGACEQHGNHLPTLTDTLIVNSVCRTLEKKMADRLILLEALPFGFSEEHKKFGGTVYISESIYEEVIVDIVSSVLTQGFKKILILNGHVGNTAAIDRSVKKIKARAGDATVIGMDYSSRVSNYLAEVLTGDRKTMGHACEIETSLMLFLLPNLVVPDLMIDSEELPQEYNSEQVKHDFSLRTKTGVLGFPSKATAEKGEKIFNQIIASLCEMISKEFFL